MRLPLSSVLSPLLRRGERKDNSPPGDEKWGGIFGGPSPRVEIPNCCSVRSGAKVGHSKSTAGKMSLGLLWLFVANKV